MRKMMISGMRIAISLAVMLSLFGTAYGLEEGFRPYMVVRFFGGLGFPAIGDLDTGLKGLSDSIIYLDMASGYSAGGGYGNIRFGYDLGGDLIFQFSPNFGIGLGSGFFRASRTTELRLTPSNPSLHNEIWTFEPAVSVVPIRVSLFVFMPIGRSLNLSLNAGPEYYFASISSLIRDEYPAWWWNEREDKATGQGFGFHGGIGLEIRLSSQMSFILEGQARLAKINDLTGTHAYRNSFGYEEQKKGTLYYWTDLWTFKPFPYISVNETLPSDPWQLNPRKAILDLSGLSPVAGILFRF